MRRLKVVAALAVAAVASGCGALSGGVYDTPLPGGADVGSDPMTISADFNDVLDLVPQSSVKVDNVAVGRVAKITLNPDGKSARVKLTVNSDTNLPAGTTARLQQTSLLGEKYVALVRPTTAVAGPAVKSGDRLALSDTSQAAQVEQVLGALSLVLNGGGVGQFQEISRELQKVSAGRPEEIKTFLRQMDSFVSGLDERKEAITEALDGMNRLSKNLDADKAKIVSALDGLSPGMQVIVDQREQLVAMLSSLDKLSAVTVETLDASQEDIIADLKALEPIVQQLAKSGSDLPNSLEILLTYPFPDSVLGAIKGDYLNVFVETNFRTLPRGCTAMGCLWSQPRDPNGDPIMAPGARRNGQGLDLESLRERGDAAPSLLPPTSSPIPGTPTPTVPVPSESVPAGTPTPSPTAPATASPTPSTPAKDGDQ